MKEMLKKILFHQKKVRIIKRIKTSIIIKKKHYKMSKLLSDSSVSKFSTKKQVEVNDISSGQYSVNKNIRFKTSLLRSDICDYSDAYIIVKGTITVEGDDDNTKRDKKTIL